MTWVVGMPTGWGYSFGLSDVRVTLANGDELDCLQKIHQVGPFVAAGFAGSVQIGFGMLEALYRLLYLEDKTRAWDPVAIAQSWPEDARKVFALFPEEERALQSHLLLLSTHPTENDGGTWPLAYGYIFRSPDFLPEQIPVHNIGAIGSGNGIVECKSAIDRIANDFDARFSLMKGEQGTHGGMGTRLGFDLTCILKRIRPSGVSAHLHYCWAYRGEVIIKTNNHSTEGQWTAFEAGSGYGQSPDAQPTLNLTADGVEAFEMPPIAASWQEFVEILDASGASAAGCVA
jgi:hypothetical protein